MPYKYQYKKLKIPRALDRRVKLTDEDKEHIKKLYKEGNGIREIARLYEHKCTRRVIQYTLFPDRLKKMNASFKENRKDGRYKPSKRAWAKTQREHRAYKQSIKDRLI